MRILVLSTFDVWPPRDGGQNRYVNLWRNFSPEHEITILAYDFRNLSGERRYRLADHVEVVVPPASESDARHFYHMQAQTGLWLHDVLCLTDYSFSTSFLRRLAEKIDECDILISAHPYLAPLAFAFASARVLKVYESYNVEFDIKRDYFKSNCDARLIGFLESVATGERYAAMKADLVTAVSELDRNRLVNLYSIELSKTAVVPNGADIRTKDLLGRAEQREVRVHLEITKGLIGIFLGSAYPANVASYRKARDMLQAAGFKGTMLLVGSINQAPRIGWPTVSFEERWLGFVENEIRDILLSASDFALHLIFAGAGTNLKLFDYMSAGIPIITNEFGRRGVEATGWNWSAETSDELASSLSAISSNSSVIPQMIATARTLGKEFFDWRSIAKRFCAILVANSNSNRSLITAQFDEHMPR